MNHFLKTIKISLFFIFIISIWHLAYCSSISITLKDHNDSLRIIALYRPLAIKELLECMYTFDQQLRKDNLMTDHNNFRYILINVNVIHNTYLKEIIYTKGWPSIDRYDAQTDHQCWLLVQHQDQDIEFQKHCLLLLKQLAKNNTNPQNYAYLYDRIAINSKVPQHYGTQGNFIEDKFIIYECDAQDYIVDERRNNLGLESLRLYQDKCTKLYAK